MAKKSASEQLRKTEGKLIDIVSMDTNLDPDQRLEFITLANSFMEDFDKNLALTSIDLNSKYGFGIDTWSVFMSHPPVKRYIQRFVRELISRQADNALMSGAGVRDAINVRKELEKQANEFTADNLIVFCLPKKNEEVYDYTDPTG